MFCYSVVLLQFPPSPQQVGLPSPQVNTVPYEFYKQPPRLPPPAMVNKQVQVRVDFCLGARFFSTSRPPTKSFIEKPSIGKGEIPRRPLPNPSKFISPLHFFSYRRFVIEPQTRQVFFLLSVAVKNLATQCFSFLHEIRSVRVH
jgi:hypothetical protein